MYRVYRLVHPLTNEIKYVGCTKRKLSDRVRLHRNPTPKDFKENKNKALWMQTLKSNGLKPKIELIGEFENYKESIAFEVVCTLKYINEGCSLFNKYIGKNLSKSVKVKISESKKGKSLSKIALNASNEKRKKTVVQLSKNMAFIKEWKFIILASKHLNVDRGDISKCCKGKIKSAGGFIWKYKEEYEQYLSQQKQQSWCTLVKESINTEEWL